MKSSTWRTTNQAVTKAAAPELEATARSIRWLDEEMKQHLSEDERQTLARLLGVGCPGGGGLGVAAHDRVQDRFLGDRHLIQYAEIFASLL